jgi:regulator of protease activity HflC (stomatin/prohibitin superfamily)
MTEAFSKILEFIVSWWTALRFWDVLPAEERGFIRRLGTHARDMKPGLNWRWPVIESAETVNGQEGVYMLDPQSLRTKDGVDMVVRCSVTFQVVCARKFHLEAWGALNNIRDLVAGEVGEAIRVSTSEDVYEGRAIAKALKSARIKAKRWGLEVVRIRCVDTTRSRSIRLWNTNTTADGQG